VAKRRPRKDRSGDHYLHLCADSGIVVVAYSDDASGVEIEQADGAGQFESVTRRPHAKLAAGSDENIARRLHDTAAKKCFIARSVSFKVQHEPTFEIASASHIASMGGMSATGGT
jgi:organic hydroperoxide reductase OsmC/OhrA